MFYVYGLNQVRFSSGRGAGWDGIQCAPRTNTAQRRTIESAAERIEANPVMLQKSFDFCM
jgi:hypothetical protein